MGTKKTDVVDLDALIAECGATEVKRVMPVSGIKAIVIQAAAEGPLTEDENGNRVNKTLVKWTATAKADHRIDSDTIAGWLKTGLAKRKANAAAQAHMT